MIISQVLNNNVLLVEDGRKRREKIIWGRGIGFKAHCGQNYNVQPCDKVFESTQECGNEYLRSERLGLDIIPKEYFQIAERLVNLASKNDNLIFDEHTPLALANYINFAVKKIKLDSDSFNPLLFDLKHNFCLEYNLGKTAQKMIEKSTKIYISESDVGFISAILISHEIKPDETARRFSSIMEIFAEVTRIIENCFEQKLAKDNIPLIRLKEHLYYLILGSRTRDKHTDVSLDCDLLNILISKNRKASVCLNEIIKYLESKVNYHCNNSDCLYILIHIIHIIE